MKIETFALERWMTAWETKTPYDIAESGIFPMTVRELLAFEPPQERDRILDHLRAKGDRKAAMADVMWALINTREFILNH